MSVRDFSLHPIALREPERRIASQEAYEGGEGSASRSGPLLALVAAAPKSA